MGIASILAVIVYFVPTIIARKRSNFAVIFIINLFLGFTFIGWVIALAMSVSKENNTTT